MEITNSDLKLIRGKRKNAELTKLAEEQRDLEYRRLFVEESKLDIIVSYTRSKLFEYLAVSILIIHILCVFIGGASSGISFLIFIILFGTSLVYKIQNKRFICTTQATLQLVDGLIKNTYGISLPKYL